MARLGIEPRTPRFSGMRRLAANGLKSPANRQVADPAHCAAIPVFSFGSGRLKDVAGRPRPFRPGPDRDPASGTHRARSTPSTTGRPGLRTPHARPNQRSGLCTPQVLEERSDRTDHCARARASLDEYERTLSALASHRKCTDSSPWRAGRRAGSLDGVRGGGLAEEKALAHLAAHSLECGDLVVLLDALCDY